MGRVCDDDDDWDASAFARAGVAITADAATGILAADEAAVAVAGRLVVEEAVRIALMASVDAAAGVECRAAGVCGASAEAEEEEEEEAGGACLAEAETDDDFSTTTTSELRFCSSATVVASSAALPLVGTTTLFSLFLPCLPLPLPCPLLLLAAVALLLAADGAVRGRADDKAETGAR